MLAKLLVKITKMLGLKKVRIYTGKERRSASRNALDPKGMRDRASKVSITDYRVSDFVGKA